MPSAEFLKNLGKAAVVSGLIVYGVGFIYGRLN